MAVTQDWTSCLESGDVATLRCIPIVLQNIINFLVIFAGVIAVFFIVFSGIRFVTSGGDPEKIASARKILTYAIIGFIIVVFSFVILNLIAKTTGVTQLEPR
ncbi:MAG: hypothetical protein COX79_04120 [Candidatus Levybacteria bacterium CG_4_10_14_0_2_um_filter_36_16]|nr:MAG: hypothetical protein AUK12_04730 [Candidatus Levybacteria bacterium CG2_30_37_29]PIR78998.1 MAG: hypothetical protein COU26_03430 [Candidatus Levybacteria bacterium CG10_big_fil_rev_8_21_14_0_10_36_30]PIZ96899.1 MAG: hypothetical protein COX79_04120 [Candidatus Levybacteria bacterium CG_4_10_14_0_2_um_filter_36_16]PJA90721.1 MAG: hypothetical protein CO136_00925 [Candidatus Levybacteria bacterium CG_4_9_14_3_um_filter_36_7]